MVLMTQDPVVEVTRLGARAKFPCLTVLFVAFSAFFAFFANLALVACAAELSVTAYVDKNTAGVGEPVQLTVEVRGASASLPEPQLPSLPNFEVVSSARSQNISIINGRVESALTFSYTLVPRFVGKAVIGPITVESEGRQWATQSIEVTIVRPADRGRASAPPSPSARSRPGAAPRGQTPGEPELLFVEASVDKSKAFVNEQVTLTVRFYTAVPLQGNPDYEPPDTTGFFSEELPPVRTSRRILHGRSYDVFELKTALFPAASGRLRIGRATIQARVQEALSLDPFSSDFFSKFFMFGGVGTRTVTVHSDPITLEVEPLPQEGRPKGYAGAVGRYSLSAVLSRSQVKVGEPIDLAVVVTGKGNLATISPPKLPELPSLRVYDTLSSLNLRKEGDVVQGSKTFKTVVVPRASGTLTLPAIPFSYFDPQTRSYQTRTVGPFQLRVAPGEAASPLGAPPVSGPGGAVAVEADIRYILEGTLKSPWMAALAAVGRARTLHVLPFLVWATGLATFLVRRSRERLHPDEARYRKALSAAQQRLRQARKVQADPARAVPLLQQALTHFLADKLALPAHGLTLRMVLSALQETAPALEAQRLQEIRDLWEELEALRYAPAEPAGGPEPVVGSLHGRLAELLSSLDGEIRRSERFDG